MERRTVFSLLSRPVSRGQYLVGKFGGITLLTATVMGLLLSGTLVAVWLGRILYGIHFFQTFSLPAVLLGVLTGFMGVTLLNSLVVLWSVVTTSSFLATLLTLATYLIGQSIDDMTRFILHPPPGVAISSSVRLTVQVSQYLFPNLAAFDLKSPAAHGLVLPLDQYAILWLYSLSYTVAVLGLAIFLFHRRDIV